VLSTFTRAEILRLYHKENKGKRAIAKALNISRRAVKTVLESGTAEVPKIEREEQLAEHYDRIVALYDECKGNVVRVHEELLARHKVETSYSTLTAYCRRNGIGVKEKIPTGSYDFGPGEEMQFDTSPHDVTLGGKRTRLQCASIVFCFSRMIFIQLYEVFTRLTARIFLTEAARFFGRMANRCVVDNTSVVVVGGSGKNAVFAPEIVAFGERLWFEFMAHEKGDKNRSAYVERPFDTAENNFYPGRTFADRHDANRQAVAWCDMWNSKFRRCIQTKAIELFQRELLVLKPLPDYIPDPYAIYSATVDTYGYVSLHCNRYSVPAAHIGSRVEIRETKDKVFVLRKHELIAEHAREESGARVKRTLPEHKYDRTRWRRSAEAPPIPEEHALRGAGPLFAAIVDQLKKAHCGRSARVIRAMHELYNDFPAEPLERAITIALEFGLTDVSRIERIAIMNTAGDYFKLPVPGEDADE